MAWKEASPSVLKTAAKRVSLLASFDGFRQQVDARGIARGIDVFQQRAFDLLTSSRLATALDLSREPARNRRCRDFDRDVASAAGYVTSRPSERRPPGWAPRE